MDFPGAPGMEGGGVESGDGADPAAPGMDGAPEGVASGAAAGDGADPRDDNAPFHSHQEAFADFMQGLVRRNEEFFAKKKANTNSQK
jgi:hypothetical protein